MKIEQIIKHLEQLDRNCQFYKQENKRLEKHIDKLKNYQTTGKWHDPYRLKLAEENYTSAKVKDAYLKAKIYEGLDNINKFDTILDTFIDFLDKKRDSQGPKK